jgi:hypothetical protein
MHAAQNPAYRPVRHFTYASSCLRFEETTAFDAAVNIRSYKEKSEMRKVA